MVVALVCILPQMLMVHDPVSASSNSANDPVIAASGDIACDRTPNAPPPDPDERGAGGCRERTTAALLATRKFTAVLTLGDEQYDSGTLPQFMSSYDKTWGTFKSITYPAPGNHEYDSANAAGYFAYFGKRAGDPTKGYYSFNIGSWHVIAINANCDSIGGCGQGSPEELWLKADLASHHASCTLAYWHQPRFSSGRHHSDPAYTAFWQDLYNAHADLVLNGHDHLYERFAPQTPTGVSDPAHGIREIIAGTGGRSHYPFTKIEPNSEVRNNAAFGIVEVTLHPHGYDWKFVPAAGAAFTDAGHQSCHG